MNKARAGFGLLGEVLDHSYSPLLHRMLGGYDYRLFPLPPDQLATFMREGHFVGLNVTIPYKGSVVAFCDQLSPMAKRTHSVNTLLRRPDGTLFGDNTDAFGFAFMAQRAKMDFAGEKVLVLGSGGTGRSVCAVVEDAGGLPVMISRKGENNYQNLDRHQDATFLVNATPVGMTPLVETTPVDLRRFPLLRGVLDVIYNPLRTRLLQQAETLGIPCEGGLSMLVAQAAKACEWFTGKPVSARRRDKVLASLREQMNNLVLVGMPGAGKTTLGRMLAKALNKPFVDLDEEIEAQEGQRIEALLRAQGETAFRDKETAQIRQWGQRGGQVIATGGGAVLRAENRENLRMQGMVVHITRPVPLLDTSARPLSRDLQALEAMWRQREPLYCACADQTVANDSTPKACLQKILEAYHEAVCHQRP